MATPKTTTKKTAAKKTTTKATVKNTGTTEEQLAAREQDLVQAKRSHKAGELVNHRVLTTTRRDIARLHTAIRAEQIASSTKEKK